ncbi:MAG: hypothetical protein R6V54_08095 [Desulfobacteraceae bacterium]
MSVGQYPESAAGITRLSYKKNLDTNALMTAPEKMKEETEIIFILKHERIMDYKKEKHGLRGTGKHTTWKIK